MRTGRVERLAPLLNSAVVVTCSILLLPYPAREEERLAAPPNLLLHTLTCFLHEQEEAPEVCCSAKTANVFDNDDDTAVFSRPGGDARKRSFTGGREGKG